MPLRVSLSHALGSRVESFEDRGVDRPLVVGRAADADLQVPSVRVSSTHCVLFVHEGRWIVQDAGSRVGTFLNGQPVRSPTPVHDGDEITLGPADSDPPRLLLEEATAGMPPTAPGAARASSAVPEWHEPTEGQHESSPETPEPAAQVATADFYAAGTGPTFPSYATASPRRRGRRNSNTAIIVTMVVLAVAFAIVATIVIAEKRKQALAPPKPAEQVTGDIVNVEDGNARRGRGSTLFSDAPMPKPTPSPTPRPAAPPDRPAEPSAEDAHAPKPAPTEPTGGEPTPPSPTPATDPTGDHDPRRRDPDWVRVEEAHRMSSPGEALAIFIDYQQRFPDSPFRGEVQGFIDEALDRLWFTRMKQLIDQREELEKRKTSVGRHLREVQRSGSADRQRVAEMTTQIQELEARIAELNKELEGEMGYDGTPFDPYNDSQVSALRAKRDKEKYDRWTKWVLGSIRRTRGALPW